MPRIVVRLLPGVSALFVVCVSCGFAFVSAAQAADATWSGADTTQDWSSGLNWLGGSAPGSTIGTLTFPDLGSACDAAQVSGPATSETCYVVHDDAGAADVNQVVVDDDTGYVISSAAASDQIQLAGAPTSVDGTTENVGLIAAFGSFGSSPYPYCCTDIGVPLALSADQVWELDGGSDESPVQTEVDQVSGTSSTLGLDFANGGTLDTTSLDTGAITLSGDGAVYVEPFPVPFPYPVNVSPTLSPAGVTVTDGAQLEIGDAGTASGPVSVPAGSNATIALTSANQGTGGDLPNGTLSVTGDVDLSSGTDLEFNIYGPAESGSTPTPSHDYTEMTATGTAVLGNAQLELDQLQGSGCFDLVPGQVYTLVSAGAVTGALDYDGSPIANGQTITVNAQRPCQLNQGYDATVAINYTARAVTATVVSGGHAGDTPTPGVATISGTPTVGSPLDVVNSGWSGSPTSYDYQWLSCSDVDCTDVGSDSPEYTPVASDVGSQITVFVTAANIYGPEGAYGPVTAETAADVTFPPMPTNDSAPTISGTPIVGDALITTPGSWDGSPAISYQWERCTTRSGTICADIGGATNSSYTLTSADVGQYVRAAVTGTNPGGSTVAYSATSDTVDDAAATPPPTTAPGSTLPAASQAQAALNVIAPPSGTKGIAALIKSGSFKTSFNAPGAGSLQVVWTASVTTGTGKKKKHKTITIATGNAQAGAAATITITIHLTRAGKTLLNQRHAGIATSATEEFMPTGGSWSTVKKKFTL